MNTSDTNKKTWIKPEVHVLSIKKDTFGGSASGPEYDHYGPPGPPSNPTPIGGK